MNSSLAAAVAAGLLLPGCAPEVSVARENDYCTDIAALPAAATIDGQLEAGLRLLPITPQGWNTTAALPSTLSARYAVAARNEGLYFFVDVATPTVSPSMSDALFCGDAVELFIDADAVFEQAPAFDDPGAAQIVIPAPVNANSQFADIYRTYKRIGPWRNATAIARRTQTGYVVEALVTAEALSLPTWPAGRPGANFAFNITIDVSGDPGPSTEFACEGRLGQFALRTDPAAGPAECKLPYCNLRSFCTSSMQPP